MTLKTSKGNKYTVDWAWAPTMKGALMLEMMDNRRLPEIAAEFDGLTRIERYDEDEGDRVWEGYNTLKAISRNDANGYVQITLCKEGETA